MCSSVFIDIAQAFDKVWHEVLNILPKYSEFREIKAGLPQGNGQVYCKSTVSTYDVPVLDSTTIATFVDR